MLNRPDTLSPEHRGRLDAARTARAQAEAALERARVAYAVELAAIIDEGRYSQFTVATELGVSAQRVGLLVQTGRAHAREATEVGA